MNYKFSNGQYSSLTLVGEVRVNPHTPHIRSFTDCPSPPLMKGPPDEPPTIRHHRQVQEDGLYTNPLKNTPCLFRGGFQILTYTNTVMVLYKGSQTPNQYTTYSV